MKLSVCLNYPWTWKTFPTLPSCRFLPKFFVFFLILPVLLSGPLTRMFRHRGRWVGQLFQLFFSSVSTGEGDHMPRWSPLAVKLCQPPGEGDDHLLIPQRPDVASPCSEAQSISFWPGEISFLQSISKLPPLQRGNHGVITEIPPNPLFPLSERGREKTRCLVQWLECQIGCPHYAGGIWVLCLCSRQLSASAYPSRQPVMTQVVGFLGPMIESSLLCFWPSFLLVVSWEAADDGSCVWVLATCLGNSSGNLGSWLQPGCCRYLEGMNQWMEILPILCLSQLFK